MNEDIILFQYQVKTKSQYGTRFYYFYADTDIENYLNNKNIKYIRYAKDTALNKKEKRIKELFKENKHYKHIIDELEKWLEEQIDYLTKIDGQNIPLKDGFEFCSMCEMYQTGKYSGLKDSIEKLQELKGSDKE